MWIGCDECPKYFLNFEFVAIHKSVEHKNKNKNTKSLQLPVLSNFAEISTSNLHRKENIDFQNRRNFENVSSLASCFQPESSQRLPAQSYFENNIENDNDFCYEISADVSDDICVDVSITMSLPGPSNVDSKCASKIKSQKLKSSLSAIACRFCSTTFKTFFGYVNHANERHKVTISKSWKSCTAGCSKFFPSSRFESLLIMFKYYITLLKNCLR